MGILVNRFRKAAMADPKKKPAAAAAGVWEPVGSYLKNTVVLATVMTVIRMPLRKAGSQMLPVRL